MLSTRPLEFWVEMASLLRPCESAEMPVDFSLFSVSVPRTLKTYGFSGFWLERRDAIRPANVHDAAEAVVEKLTRVHQAAVDHM
jgi:hypothetical protein